MRVLTMGLALAVTVGAAQTDPVVHMSKEPRHKVVFESGTIRVQDVQIPSGDTSLFHIHDHALLYVPISGSPTRTQALGQEWRGGGASASSAGKMATTPVTPGRVTSNTTYVENPITHRVQNIGNGLFRLIAVGNLSKGADVETDDLSGLSPKPEMINRYYRAYRVSLAPGQSTAAHKHAWPVVLVQQTGGHLAIEGSSKATTTEAGKFAFHDGTGTHTVTNTGTTPAEFVEVEVRGSAPK
jgi:hypothetical protein